MLKIKNQAANVYLHTHNQALEVAKAHLKAAQERQQRYANQFRRDVSYEPGDMVLLSTEHFKPSEVVQKRSPKRCGPWKVLKRIGPAAYELDLEGRMPGVHPVFHVSRLSPLYVSDRYTTEDRSLRPGTADYLDLGPEVFLVDKIVGMRTVELPNGEQQRQFLIHWKGYDKSEDSWEPEASLLLGFDVDELIKEFIDNPPVEHNLRRSTRTKHRRVRFDLIDVL